MKTQQMESSMLGSTKKKNVMAQRWTALSSGTQTVTILATERLVLAKEMQTPIC